MLQPASFRGVPFAVVTTASQFGRRIAVHQYPGRDKPWVEDLGRSVNSYRVQGFLVTDAVYGGGAIEDQRRALIAAIEAAGPGTLVHPTLGTLQVAVQSGTVGEARDAGRYSDIELILVDAGQRDYPQVRTVTGDAVTASADAGLSALNVDTAAGLTAAIGTDGTTALLAPAARDWTGEVSRLADDATAAVRLVTQLPGNFGRFARGGNAGYLLGSIVGLSGPYAGAASVAALVVTAAGQRAGVASAVASLFGAIGGFTVTTAAIDIAISVGTLVTALGTACADPGDRLRLMSELAGYVPVGPAGASATGLGVAASFRRAAVLDLSRAAAVYQPASYDDAQAVLARATAVLDREITVAADAGQDDSFRALRSLRAAVVTDLRARGAALAPLRRWQVPAALPALVLAQRFYRDPTRADQLVGQAAPVHPLLMPTDFQALAA